MFKNILYDCGPVNDVLQLLLSIVDGCSILQNTHYKGLGLGFRVLHMAGSLVHGANFISKSKFLYTGKGLQYSINSSFRASPGVLSMRSCTLNLDEEM